MSKRFKVSLEEMLEVDKAAEENAAASEVPESKKVLDAVVEAAEAPAEDTTTVDAPPITDTPVDEPSADAPIEVPEDNTTLDGTAEPEMPPDDGAAVATPEASEIPADVAPEATPADETPPEEAPPAVEPEVKENPTDIASLSEVNDTLREDELNDEQIDRATDVATTLEEIAEQLEASIDRGGLSETAAAITKASVDRLCERVGIIPNENQEISLESFKTISGRLRKTKVTLESIGEYIGKIWDAFVAAIGRGIEWLKGFVQGLFNDYSKYKNDIKILKEAVAKLNDKTIVDPSVKFTDKGAIDFLKSGLPSPDLDTLKSFTKSFYDLVETRRAGQVNHLKDVIDASTKGNAVPVMINLPRLESTLIVKDSISGYQPTDKHLESFYARPLLPGNKRFLAFYPAEKLFSPNMSKEDVDAYNSAMEKSGFYFVVDPLANKKEVTDFKVLSKVELSDFVVKLEALCNQALSAKPIFEKFIKEKTEVKQKLEVLIKEQSKKSKLDKVSDTIDDSVGREKSDEPNINEVFRPIKAQFTLLKQTYEVGSGELSRLIIGVIKASLTYGNFCVKENLKSKAPVAAPAPAYARKNP